MKRIGPKASLWIIGIYFTVIYILLLLWRPQESWCDDAFWADWGRQMGLNGLFTSNVWGAGKPSYSPGYALLLAGVFRIFGFSFLTAQIPDILLSFCAFIILGYSLLREKASKLTVFIYGLLFWCLYGMFYVINCGRPEVLSMLLAIAVAVSFVRKRWLSLLIASILLMGTSVQGVVAATLFIVIYECFNHKEIIPQRHLLYSHFGGYVIGLGATAYLMYRNHCLKAFFDTLFGYSKTLTSFYLSIRTFAKSRLSGNAVDDAAVTTISSGAVSPPSSSADSSLFTDILNSYTDSLEYLVCIALIIGLTILLVMKRERIGKVVWSSSVMALVAPLVFILMGRYAAYYCWAAFIPCIFSICSLLSRIKMKPLPGYILASVTVIALAMNFISNWSDEVVLDFKHEKDKANLEEIALAGLSPDEPAVIPYSWYYYVIEHDENVFFQYSGKYPETLTRVIYDPTDVANNPSFMKSCEFVTRLKDMEEWVRTDPD